MENQLIIIYPYRFRDFDRKRFEVDYLKQYTNIVIHELINTLHPNFSPAYHVFDKSKDVIRFSNLKEWRKEYLKNIKSFKGRTYVLNFVSILTFKELLVNYILSASDVCLIQYSNPGVITDGDITRGYISKIRTKYLFIINRASFKWLFIVISHRLIRILYLYLCRRSDIILAVNTKHHNHLSRVVPANSFDYSMVMGKIKGNKFENYSQDSIIYLDTGAPLFSSDSLLYGNRNPISEAWYPALENLFNIIEKKTGNKVVIAAHPKHKYSKKNEHIFGNRKIFHGKTIDLVAHASQVLVTNSTSVSYAVMFNKPVLVLVSNEIIEDNNILLQQSNYLSSSLGCSTINIDKIDEKLVYNFSINSDKYLTYKSRYLSARLDNKTNGEIISEIVLEESIINNAM